MIKTSCNNNIKRLVIVCQWGNPIACFFRHINNSAAPNKTLTTGAISKPKTAMKLAAAIGYLILGTNMTISEKTKHRLHIMANLDKNAKMGLKRLIFRSVI